MPADHPSSELGMLWVRLPPGPLGPHGAVRSARLVVNQKATGSNPVGGAEAARYANRQSGQAQTLVIVCGFDSHSCHCRAAFPTALCKSVVGKQVGWKTRGSIPSRLMGSLTGGTSVQWWLITTARRVRLPNPALWPSGETGRHASSRGSCPQGRGSSSLPLVTDTGEVSAVGSKDRPGPVPIVACRLPTFDGCLGAVSSTG
jgi:hypothetical protein